MNKIASFVKSLRLKQIALVFFAGVMLLLNTACNGPAQAKDTDALGDGGPHPANQVQPYKGGMNNFDDTPPEQIPANKAKSLVDNAQRNIQDKDPRNAKLYKNPGYAAERTTDKLGNDLKERVDNAKEQVGNFGDRAAKIGESTTAKTKELGQRIQKGTENVTDNVGNSVVGAGEDTKYKTKQAGEKIKGAVKDAID